MGDKKNYGNRKLATSCLVSLIFVLGAIFLISSSPANAASTTDALVPVEAPKLNVQIPGLKFSTDVTFIGGEKVKIPFLAQYLAAIYNYLIGASLVAAAVMIVYGGFLFVIGSTISQVKRGKEVISDAIIGLILVLTSYTVLFTLNENFAKNNQALELQTVKKEKQELETISTNDYWKALRKGGLIGKKKMGGGQPQAQSQAQTTQAAGGATELPPPTPDAPPGNTVEAGCKLELNSLKLPTKESVYKCGIQVAKEVGIEPCIMVVVLNHESWDGLPNSLGFDENAPNGIPRLDFLRSGKLSYPKDGTSGFAKPAIPAECSRATLTKQGKTVDEINAIIAKCDAARNSRIYNNDIKNFDPEKTDLGLDWKSGYSRGVGLMQTTIFRKQWCSGGPSWKAPTTGECYTPQQLLDVYTGLKAGALELKANANKGLEGMFQAWNQDVKYYKGLAQETETCIQSKYDPLQFMSGPYICRGDFSPYSVKACKEENRQREIYNKTAPPGQKKWLFRKNCENVCYDSRNPLTSSMIQP